MGENAEEEKVVFGTKVDIETFNIDEFPNWKKCVNSESNTAHLFYYGEECIGYPQIEVTINDEGFWKIRHEGRERKIYLDWADISNGDPAAFVEVNPSQHHKKSIRSTNCLIFIPYDEALQPANEVNEICAACGHSQHYLRTLKSRIYSQNQIGEKNKVENSKFTRFDYLDKDDLMHLLREKNC